MPKEDFVMYKTRFGFPGKGEGFTNIYTCMNANGAQLIKKLIYEIVVLQLLAKGRLSLSDVNCMGIGRLFLIVKPRK